MNACTPAFAVLILTVGRLADLFGRRRLFAAGLTLLTASSLAYGRADGAPL